MYEIPRSNLFIFLLVLSFLETEANGISEGISEVHCNEHFMDVKVDLTNFQSNATFIKVYLDGFKSYSNNKCSPYILANVASFHLPLTDFFECGFTRIIHKKTGNAIYYHRIIVETNNNKKYITAKCMLLSNSTTYNHRNVRRDILPQGFEEPADLDIITSLTGNAPEPVLGVLVRQNGEVVTDELNVSPGTPLTMEIFLDEMSSSVYGLGVTYMQVTDTKYQEETIIFNGCSVDPYLFDNFDTVNGDLLLAKFRAFKFPESNYVQFRGTVNVCLDKCIGSSCSNGQIGRGRRRKRSVDSKSQKNTNIFEISMTTIIKVTNNESKVSERQFEELKLTNRKLEQFNLPYHLSQIKKNVSSISDNEFKQNDQMHLSNAPQFISDKCMFTLMVIITLKIW